MTSIENDVVLVSIYAYWHLNNVVLITHAYPSRLYPSTVIKLHFKVSTTDTVARPLCDNWAVLYRVFQKSSSKTFWNIFTSVKSFCMKFCKFAGSSYPHILTNFCRFILIFRQTLRFWVGIFTQKKCTFSEMTSFFIIACLSVRKL